TELRLIFRRPPRLGFITGGHRRPPPGQIVVKLDPTTGIRIVLDALRADAPGPNEIRLDMDFAAEGGEGAPPYEVLLQAALEGDLPAPIGVGAVVRQAGPRLVRDGFGPLAIFFTGWKLIGLTAGILMAAAFGLAIFVHERRAGRPAAVVRLALLLVAIRAIVG